LLITDSSYTYSYDQADRLIQTSNAGTAGVPTVLFDYGYDAANYLIITQDTIAGQVRGLTTVPRDRLNRVTQIQQSGVGVTNKRVDMNYDAASQLKQISRYTDLAGTQPGAISDHDYDLAGRLESLLHQRSNTTTIANYGLTYDAGNRITQITSIDGTATFNYDVTNQVTGADYSFQADEGYTYDLNGNRTNAGNQTGGNNQLLTDGTYNYAYDNEGNRISRTTIATGEVTEYSWDYRNRLTQVLEKNGAGVVVRSSDYRYDVFDRRIGKTVDLDGVGTQVALTERYVYDGDHIALVFDGAGNQLQRFLYGTQVDQVLVQENGDGSLYWALSDHQGTVRDVVDSQGNVLNHIVYDSFGNVVSETNTGIDFRFGYTGRELDAETGLYYYRARYYDATTGQFIGQDPIGFSAGDSNLYRYVGNSATNYTDPSGLFWQGAKRWGRDRWNDVKNSEFGYGVRGVYQSYTEEGGVIDQFKSDPVGATVDTVNGGAGYTYEKITSKAEEATETYAPIYNDESANLVVRGTALVGGSLSSLGTRENFDKTRSVLEGALLVSAFIQIAPALAKGCASLGKQLHRPVGAVLDDVVKVGQKAGDDFVQLVKKKKQPAELEALGKPAGPLDKTLDHALNPEQYLNDVATKYGINLRGSGQKINIKFDPKLGRGSGRLGVTKQKEGGRIIRVGPDALVDEGATANTIAHELSHARDYLRGGVHKRHDIVYAAGNALEELIKGMR
jgi:RHS repeat-associated protein